MAESDPHEIDLHRLELRYVQARLPDPRAIERLRQSIERCGQRQPLLVVAVNDSPQLVLLDGYRRVAALKRLGRDTALIEPLGPDLTSGLIAVLTRAHGRAFAAIEEALLLRELIDAEGFSQHEAARRCGRDVSWVNRRLQLLCGLSEPLLQALRAGSVSTWSATRVLVPLARANASHAERLLGALRAEPLSTRELRAWFEHYQRSLARERERLVAHPRLLAPAMAARTQAQSLEALRAGPEGECLRDIGACEAILARLRKRLPALSSEPAPSLLRTAFFRLTQTFTLFQHDLSRWCKHDQRADTNGDPHAPGPRAERAPHCEAP